MLIYCASNIAKKLNILIIYTEKEHKTISFRQIQAEVTIYMTLSQLKTRTSINFLIFLFSIQS